MIVFALSVYICTTPPSPPFNECNWVQIGEFLEEDYCHEIGKLWLNESREAEKYKCVISIQEKEWQQ